MPTVVVQDVSKTYRLGKLTITALNGVSFTVAPGECLAIVGPSGSGKTTLLDLIGCLDTPSAGEIELDGIPVGRLSARQRTDLCARKLFRPSTSSLCSRHTRTWSTLCFSRSAGKIPGAGSRQCWRRWA
jgi:putative ABC transport system ATP-binding protein